jgi:arabinose-5-phosphate isomerase
MIIKNAKRVLEIESKAITNLIAAIDDNFKRAVEFILRSKGKVVVTGIGKSGIICKKIASTLTSTGTPSIFLHPAEAAHGDLGMIVRDDIVIAISNSGESEELVNILPVIKRMGIKLICITGKESSALAKFGDVVLIVDTKEEACPLGLVPTASTTAMLALGDAIAISLLQERGFKKEDFALFHPGGSLGRRLLLTVKDMMHAGDDVPLVKEDTLMKEALFEITSKRFGITGVVNSDEDLIGVITDGDLRRALEKDVNMLDKKAKDIMSRNPKIIYPDSLAAKALNDMEKYSITTLFVCKTAKKVIGIVHIHDLLKKGVV